MRKSAAGRKLTIWSRETSCANQVLLSKSSLSVKPGGNS